MKLRSRILSFSLPLFLIPLLLVSLAAYIFILRTYEERERNQLSIRLNESKSGVVDIASDLDQRLKLVASAPSIRLYLTTVNAGGANAKERETALNLLTAFKEQDPYHLEVALFGSEGKVELSVSNLADNDRKEARTEAFFLASAYRGATESPVFGIGNNGFANTLSTIISTESFLGLLTVTVDSRKFLPPLAGRVQEGTSLVCFDDRGVAWLTATDSALTDREIRRFNWLEIDKPGTSSNGPSILNKEISGRDFEVFTFPLRRFAINGTFERGPGQSWYIGVVEPVSAPTGLRAFQLAFAAILLFSTFAVIWLSAVSARRITKPIEEVSRATSRIAKGYEDLELNISTGDEVEDLARAVTDMNTDLREYQARLVDSARLAAMGEMTSEISHEIQNRISGISLWLQHLDAEVSKDDERREYIEEMKLGLGGFIDMLSGLKRFYKKPRLDKAGFDFGQMVEESILTIAEKAEEKEVETIAESAETDLSFFGDREKLRGVVINLLLNAIEASPENGTVRIKTISSEKSLTVCVIDEGSGIRESERHKIFFPFYTTKASGSGLGLGISKNIVDAHGGTIRFYEAVGGGAEFRLMLPVEETN